LPRADGGPGQSEVGYRTASAKHEKHDSSLRPAVLTRTPAVVAGYLLLARWRVTVDTIAGSNSPVKRPKSSIQWLRAARHPSYCRHGGDQTDPPQQGQL